MEQTIDLEDRRIDYLPTLTQIAKASARIRSGWTQSEKRRRFVGELVSEQECGQDWLPPVIDTSHFRLCVGSAQDAG